MLATTPKARFSVEEQLSDGSARAVVRWRYDCGDGHVRGVQVRNGKLADSLAGTPLATEQLYVCGSRDRDTALDGRAERTAGIERFGLSGLPVLGRVQALISQPGAS